ncbi:MAG: heme exporter protein CcmD [Pseudomonadota bacterium]|nr:heme exporter protein CcmD [Pseudomonadota bacterium]
MGLDPAYAAYVWSAYGLSAAVLLWLAADTLGRARRWRRQAQRRKKGQP